MAYFSPDEMASMERMMAQRASSQQLRASVTPQQSQQVSALAGQYPWASAQVIAPLALGGVKPGDPAAQAAANAELKRQANRGWGFHNFGDFVKAGGALAKSEIGKTASLLKQAGSAVLPDEVGQTLKAAPVKGFVRGAFMGLDALPQAIQGEFRNNLADDGKISPREVLGVMNPLNLDFTQSDAGAGLSQIVENRGLDKLDYGSGFFAGGAVKREGTRRRRNAAPEAMIDGHAPSIGRYFGAKVFEPGTRSYSAMSGLLDAAVLLGADPTTFMGGGGAGAGATRVLGSAGVREASQDAKLLVGDASSKFRRSGQKVEINEQVRNAAGLVTGTRKTLLPDKASEWLLSKPGQRVVSHLAEETDFYKLRKMFGGKIETDTLVKLADSRSTQEVYDILGPELGIAVREKPAMPLADAVSQRLDGVRALGPLAMTVRQRLNADNVRMLGQVPGSHVDLTDVDDAVEQLDRFMLNAKMSPDLRAARVTEMARAGDRNARFEVLKGSLRDTQRVLLEERGVDRDVANQLTRMWDDYDAEYARYAVDEHGENMAVPGVILDAASKPLPTPHLASEYLQRAAPLPDARELRRVTSRYAGVLSAPGMQGSVAALDFVTQQLFKPLVLLRGAWTVRVVGEEQIRLASSGLTSAFMHPLSHLAVAQGKNLKTGLTGDVIAESQQALDALARGSNGLIDDARNKIRTKHKTLLDRGRPGFEAAWSDELAKLHNDPLAARLAAGALRPGDGTPNPAPGVDGIKDWFFNGTGHKFRKEIGVDLSSRQASDAYVDSVLQRILAKTGGDAELHEVVATGRHGGKLVFGPHTVGSVSERRAMRAFRGTLTERALRNEGPEKVVADMMVTARRGGGGRDEVFARMDKVTETMFNTLMSRPSNYLSRSPAFHEFYWRRSGELVRHMTPQAQADAVAAARAANVDPQTVAKMEKDAAAASGRLSTEDADIIAKGFGLDSTRKLLYDLHDRSQFFDITRTIFPFGEAWKEVLTTWARIGMENPVVARRFGQAVEGGRDADLDGDGRGILHPDPAGSPDEMISFPMTGQFTKLITGVPAPMQGPAKGLNVFSQSTLPGFGPMVQMAAGALVPEDPAFNAVRKAIIPFGEPDTQGGYFESLLPAWWKKVKTSGYVSALPMGSRSPAQQRQYQNTAIDVMRYLASTGEYDLGSPQDQQRLLKDANHKASVLFLIRGIAQNVAPTPPSPEFVAQDKDGRMMLTFKMAEEYRALQEEDYRTATARFIDKFGEDAFLVTISKSEGGGAVTDKALEFRRRNPALANQYQDVFSLFVTPGGEFDMTEYQRQLAEGSREPRSPQEALDLANSRVGAMLYNKAKASVGDKPNAEGRAWLRQVRDLLVERYPGYAATPASMGDTERLISTLQRAAKEPKLAETDAGQGLTLYLQARDQAVKAARQMDLTGFSTSQKAAGLRDWLREVADAITDEHPDFAEMFDRALSRELGEDTRGQLENG